MIERFSIIKTSIESTLDTLTGYPDAESLLFNEDTSCIALATASVMLPDVIRTKGCLIRKSAYDEAGLDRWLKTTAGDVRSVESVINRVNVFDLFKDADETVAKNLAYLIYYSWSSWLPVVADGGVQVFLDFTSDGPSITFVAE